MNLIKAPLLLLVFNRPEKTLKVWEQIQKARPAKLYISSDAPRLTNPEDKEKVRKVRKIVQNIDWPCQVKYLFHDVNLGCSLAGKTAFDWIFTYEDRMIELEDDTIPSQSFFSFMEELLEKYKDNERVGFITGQNFMGIKSGKESYFFSHYFGSSGWGTWKRIYNKWDYKLENFKEIVSSMEFRKHFDSRFEYRFWMRKFDSYVKKGGNTYDLQSVFMTFKDDLLNIIPNENLITNIGFDSQGSNYNGGNEKFADKSRFELTEIYHPKEIKRSKTIDKKFFNFHFLAHSRFSYQVRWFVSPVFWKIKSLNFLK